MTTQTDNAQNPENHKVSDPYVGLINQSQLARCLRKSEWTIKEWRRTRKIPYVRIGRNILFKLAAVERALEKYVVREVSL